MLIRIMELIIVMLVGFKLLALIEISWLTIIFIALSSLVLNSLLTVITKRFFNE